MHEVLHVPKAFTLLRIIDDELSHAERKWSRGLRGVTSLLDTKLIFKRDPQREYVLYGVVRDTSDHDTPDGIGRLKCSIRRSRSKQGPRVAEPMNQADRCGGIILGLSFVDPSSTTRVDCGDTSKTPYFTLA